jgi:hypothetical protein
MGRYTKYVPKGTLSGDFEDSRHVQIPGEIFVGETLVEKSADTAPII